MDKIDLRELLSNIDPSRVDYEHWTMVGMALKHEGYSVDVWDSWSSRDPGRYHAGECEKKWRSFQGNPDPVTGGTIYQIAKEQGWIPSYGHELDWNDAIREERVVIDKDWIELQEIEEPKEWNPVRQIIEYLETLFEAGENVGYVMQSYVNEDGRATPGGKGNYDRTAGQLIEELSRCGGDIGSVLGDYDPNNGAWIRFNPLNGQGVKNADVTEFRYALVESDNMELERQNALIRELELPVAVLVYSGGKSLHAIVRVDARDYNEYRTRVNYLYDVCEKNGMTIDKQNRNPSRLSRLPGVTRGEKKQFIAAKNIGKKNWDEWYEWIEGINDDLPDMEPLDGIWNDMPELSPELIKGVLRKGHKMLVVGPSKSGKSFLLIELCIAIAEGRKWLEWQCAKGSVLYVNLELDRASCLHRFKDVYQAMKLNPENLRNIDIWNLRGKSVPMDKLAPKLIRRAQKKNYTAVIIDPIYKVITGDENSADQMAAFCNQFDRVCTELNCAVIYCHHHSKGAQGQKKSMDRASGSGVFARDPDALLDMIQLQTTDSLMAQEVNKAICGAVRKYLEVKHISGWDWKEELSQDTWLNSKELLNICENRLNAAADFLPLKEAADMAADDARQKTAWRVDGILREFRAFDPVNIWFDYPAHTPDESGALKDIEPEEEKAPWEKRKEARAKVHDAEREVNHNAFRITFEGAAENNMMPLEDMAESIGVTEKTISKWLGNDKKYSRTCKELRADFRISRIDGVPYIKKRQEKNQEKDCV